jgi:hypothetical protein
MKKKSEENKHEEFFQDYEEFFQDRVDELLLLEQRADRRAEKFIEITNDYQEKSQQALDDLLGKVSGIDTSLAKINAASDQIGDYVFHSEKHALGTAKLFLGTVIVCALFVAGTLWWSRHIVNELARAKADLAALDIKLKHKPVLVNFKGTDYVRVVPNSETGFTSVDGSDVSGQYAKVWHVR